MASAVTEDRLPVYKTSKEYFTALEQWLANAYHWQCVAAAFPVAYQAQQYQFQEPTNHQENSRQQNTLGVECYIPPLWKRFAAEVFDFILLFVVKLVVTFVAVDYFEFVEIDKYDLDFLQSNIKINYKVALQMTSEIVILEIVHRLVVCVYETLCLYRGHRTVGGATPGKNLMGIKVLLCDQVIPIGENRVIVRPATDLGFCCALWRSVIKNFSLAFFVPVSFTLFFFQHHRTAYDILCRSIVVEDTPIVR